MAERDPLPARRPDFHHPTWLGGGELEAAVVPPRHGVGAVLRAAREEAAQSLADAAARLRIRRVYLEAIEESRFDDLPGTVYAIGFVRSYAETMGLDGDLLVKQFKMETSANGSETELHFPEPIPEGHLPGWRLLVISAVLVIGVYGAWNYWSSQNRIAIELVPDVPERIAGLAGLPTPAESRSDSPPRESATVASSAGAALGSPQSIAAPSSRGAALNTSAQVEFSAEPAALPLAAPALVGAERAAAPTLETETVLPELVLTPTLQRPGRVETAPAMTRTSVIASTGEASDSPLPSAVVAVSAVTKFSTQDAGAAGRAGRTAYVPQVYGAANSDARIVVTALMDSWVQVTDTNNALHLTRILRGGDKYRAPNRPDLILTTGNAGALEIVVDGQPVPPLGPLGAVRRNILLSPERLLAGTAVTQ